ncbi:DMT family transporter [Fredinandcohnia sp. QZ13]|uniref:DMT family transporter n=1 Tax=Fredinandcohnia sp. QZ13 TaxID=3073144 RepID=UPI0028533187|nr:DMT family transporter [Fredinandcohnia sp. QZ13]MDR4887533.1 DMT family transporter [Fredinandcohnia sp. QZ13]
MKTLLGLFFTFLWSSAAIATKFGLNSTTPLVLATTRFLIAGGLLFLYVYILQNKYPWPKLKEWRSLIILGLLNTTIYLGATFWALNYVSAGIFNLFVTTNPFIVAFLSFIWLKRSIYFRELMGMIIAAMGLVIATWPTITGGDNNLHGFVILGIGMTSMATGSVYFKKVNLKLPSIVINTWQVLIGGILLIPVTYILEKNVYFLNLDFYLYGSLIWLVFVISIGTMILWFYLLKQDTVKANNWLFMTPVFGYILANIFLNEPINVFDITATFLVIVGLFLSGNIEIYFIKKFLKGNRRVSSETSRNIK